MVANCFKRIPRRQSVRETIGAEGRRYFPSFSRVPVSLLIGHVGWCPTASQFTAHRRDLRAGVTVLRVTSSDSSATVFHSFRSLCARGSPVWIVPCDPIEVISI